MGGLASSPGRDNRRAKPGEKGRGKQQTGACGPDLKVFMPVGTRIFDSESGDLICDLVDDEQVFVAAQGGEAGRGNLSLVLVIVVVLQ